MTVYNKQDIEILVSTMNKRSLDFLIPMFPFSHFSHFSILVINQTDKDCLLHSDYKNVRVLNSFEKGLSKSRNLAINSAIKKICLIADDDVVYSPSFQEDIVVAFDTMKEASIITFNHQRKGLLKPQNKSLNLYKHTIKSIYNVVSIEIAFKLDEIKENKIYFDENFGLGSVFETAEEFLFLRESLKLNLKMYYYPSIIVTHPTLCSGEYHGDNKLVFARAALFYKTRGIIAYLWLVKYIYFLVSNNYIAFNECFMKYKTGYLGIKKYKCINEN